MTATTSTVARTAMTWIGKAVAMLRSDGDNARNAEARWLTGYEAGAFMRSTLGELENARASARPGRQ
jgi:hypothetical protein